jgi:Protein of unknown function (DUF4013)
MNSVGDGFAWAFRDPAWPGKMLVQGLIAIIPIVGWVAMNGWLMVAFENARAGKNELPPAGFHLGRGFPIFVVFLVYSLVLNLPALVFLAIGGGVNFHYNSQTAYNTGSPLSSLGYLLSFAAGLLLRFLIAPLIINTYHRGFNGGFDVATVWRMATANVSNGVITGLVIWVASFIGGIGFFLCCIGLIFTIPYENTIIACAAAWLEKEQAPPAPQAPPAAA